MNVLTAQLGARMYYAVPRILERSGMLEHFHTDLLGDRGWPKLLGMVPGANRSAAVRRMTGRKLSDVPDEKVTAHAALTLGLARKLRRAASPREVAEAYVWAGDELCRRAMMAGFGKADAVFVVGSSSRLLFQAAKSQGLMTVMESIIAAPSVERELLEAEALEFPEWRDSATAVSAINFEELVRSEWELADCIVCGSEFVRQSIRLAGGPAERCVVVPYGLDQPVRTVARVLDESRPLRVLTVGAVGLRKGSHYVIRAAAKAGRDFNFRMAGPLTVDKSAVLGCPVNLTLLGHVPRAEIGLLYEWADVFLLPSLCEGSATVVFEAMAYGLPIVTTPNSGTVVTDEREGFVVPIRDEAAVVAALQRLRGDAGLYQAMSRASLNTARRYSFSYYEENLVNALKRLR